MSFYKTPDMKKINLCLIDTVRLVHQMMELHTISRKPISLNQPNFTHIWYTLLSDKSPIAVGLDIHSQLVSFVKKKDGNLVLLYKNIKYSQLPDTSVQLFLSL